MEERLSELSTENFPENITEKGKQKLQSSLRLEPGMHCVHIACVPGAFERIDREGGGEFALKLEGPGVPTSHNSPL